MSSFKLNVCIFKWHKAGKVWRLRLGICPPGKETGGGWHGTGWFRWTWFGLTA